VLDALARRFARPVRLVPVAPSDLRAAVLAAARDVDPPDEPDAASALDADHGDDRRLRALADEAPVVTVVDALLRDALRLGASDVHLESAPDGMRVRFRLDGVLQDVQRVAPALRAGVVSRVKVLAGLDVAERRRPQDGRARVRVSAEDGRPREVDLRVATLPALHGESVVLRVLDHGARARDLEALGMPAPVRARLERVLARTTGLVLVTGPTGSGKTNTLYSALAKVNSPEVNIMTAEDPVEFNLPGINQVQMKESIGLNFAATLRSFLRQDPNIILVGEIRDFETAEIAIKAALTGHLVLSTLHTNDAPSTINRLMNMGIEPFLVATATQLIAAQRLTRRICSFCKEAVEMAPQALANLGYKKEEIGTFTVYKGRGCEKCNNTGYKGRVALIEVMTIDDDIRDLILSGGTAIDIKRKAMENGMMTLRLSGLAKIKEGVTTVEEVVRETVL
jgi:type IV pilus assembly protein PilB